MPIVTEGPLIMPAHLEIVIKPTLQCNGICDYCNAVQRPAVMDVAVVERLFRNLARYLDGSPQCSASILWHGGEPMLMGTRFYSAVLELDRAILNGCALHIMQSNLTLASADMLNVLRELLNGGGIGTSLDPFENYRKLKDGTPYLQKWYEGFEAAGSSGFRVGMVYVVHGKSPGRARDIYYYFRNLGVDSLTVIPLEEPAGPFQEPRLEPRSWGRFLIDIYNVWNEDDRFLPMEPFSGWENLSYDRNPATRGCNESLSCCEPTLAVSPEGDVYPCVRHLDTGIGKTGNIMHDDMDAIMSYPDMSWRSARSKLIKQGDCASCKWWKLCAGGCAAGSGYLRKTIWCEGLKLFFEASDAQ